MKKLDEIALVLQADLWVGLIQENYFPAFWSQPKLSRAKLEQTSIFSEPNVNKKCKTHSNSRNNYFCTLFVFTKQSK